ncbi:MAG: hypothetical protein PHT59_04445 [Candidatus Omnitrophica bacterium]|nr:hypothetical protein [Candidatus Omnitrophota bacterium]
MKKYVILIFVAAWFSCLSWTEPAEAAFSISVRPFEGGYDLRFGNISAQDMGVDKELVVNVTSDTGTRYQVIQTLLDPLTNNEGYSLHQSNFLVNTLAGSNTYGTLRLSQGFPVSGSRTILYTSGPTGLSDSFRLVYGLRGPLAPGSYRGRIAFVLEPVGSSANPVTVILNVSAEVSAATSIEIKPVRATSVLRLSKSNATPYGDSCAVTIQGIMGRQFRIMQALSRPFESQHGEVLPDGAINFSLQSVARGTVAGGEDTLTQRQQVVYTSSAQGEPEKFLITYTLASAEKYTAGLYRSRVNYFVDGLAGGQTMLAALDCEVEVPRIFDLVAKPQESGIIEFRTGPNVTSTQADTVIIEIRTNNAKPYQVSQKFSSELVSRDGSVMPQEFFTVRTEKIDTAKGTLKFPLPEPVKTSDTVLFVSDAAGSPDAFKVIYELRPSVNVPAGDYSASVMYTISEI